MKTDGMITILDPLVSEVPDGGAVITMQELKERIRSGRILGLMFRYREARLLTPNLNYVSSPLLKALFLRFMSRGRCFFEDESCRRGPGITYSSLFRMMWRFGRDLISRGALIKKTLSEVEKFKAGAAHRPAAGSLDLAGRPVYLRTDPNIALRSGGSVGHIAGVLNNLDRFTGSPVFLTNSPIPTVREDIESHIIAPSTRFRDFEEIPHLAINDEYESAARRILDGEQISFIYQRYSFNSFSGVKLARLFSVPLVLEYNGSEIWIRKNWSEKPYRYEYVYQRIEELNLEFADLIVVVSSPLKNELTARGIAAEKILVNPNGVDPEKYSPSVDGSPVRSRYGLGGKTVIGFIGTFGRWHGAEVLAEAFGRMINANKYLHDDLRLLMIGDGLTMPSVKSNIEKYGVGEISTLTGFVPQEQGPAHLAACDILASPHVPNKDGSPFFGSPTKLFEYMAMGKGIVASDLDQIGEILEHNVTAWMVPPGDPEELAAGLLKLVEDPGLGERLGCAAREEAIEKYTWERHTARIITKLKELRG